MKSQESEVVVPLRRRSAGSGLIYLSIYPSVRLSVKWLRLPVTTDSWILRMKTLVRLSEEDKSLKLS